MTTTFHLKINDGPEQTITTKSSIYREAVAACPAVFGINLPAKVEIWIPELQPEYPPTKYAIHDDEFGRLVIGTLDERQ